MQDTPRQLPLAGPPHRKLIMNAVPLVVDRAGHRCVSVGTYMRYGAVPIGGGPVSDVGVPDRLA